MGLLGKYFGDNYDSVAGVFWIDDFGSCSIVELPRHRSSVPELVTSGPELVEGTVTSELATLVASTGSATQRFPVPELVTPVPESVEGTVTSGLVTLVASTSSAT